MLATTSKKIPPEPPKGFDTVFMGHVDGIYWWSFLPKPPSKSNPNNFAKRADSMMG